MIRRYKLIDVILISLVLLETILLNELNKFDWIIVRGREIKIHLLGKCSADLSRGESNFRKSREHERSISKL